MTRIHWPRFAAFGEKDVRILRQKNFVKQRTRRLFGRRVEKDEERKEQ